MVLYSNLTLPQIRKELTLAGFSLVSNKQPIRALDYDDFEDYEEVYDGYGELDVSINYFSFTRVIGIGISTMSNILVIQWVWDIEYPMVDAPLDSIFQIGKVMMRY